MNEVKLRWQIMILLFILFCFFYADFFVIDSILVETSRDCAKGILLSYCFCCKRIKYNSHENIVRELIDIYKRDTLHQNIFITFFCVIFLFFSVSNCVCFPGGVFFYLKLFA